MVSAWIKEEIRPPSPEFDEFMALYRALRDKKTGSLEKLCFRIKKIWESFPLAKKKDFTQRLIDIKILPPEVEELLKIFKGTIMDFGSIINTKESPVK